jgi:TolB-like protein
MSRLRKGLAEYYAADGADDPWHFEFPVRGYVPSWTSVAAPLSVEPVPTIPAKRSRIALRIALAAAILLGIAGLVLWRIHTAAAPIRAVVVLPFANLTGDLANDYLTDGITESLTDSLARVDSLRVVARTSAFQFRNKARDIREIGRLVDADAVVEGSIRRVADHLAVTVQVNRSADGFHILSRVFEGKLPDLVNIERQLAVPVLAVLRPGLRVPPPPALPIPKPGLSSSRRAPSADP